MNISFHFELLLKPTSNSLKTKILRIRSTIAPVHNADRRTFAISCRFDVNDGRNVVNVVSVKLGGLPDASKYHSRESFRERYPAPLQAFYVRIEALLFS